MWGCQISPAHNAGRVQRRGRPERRFTSVGGRSLRPLECPHRLGCRGRAALPSGRLAGMGELDVQVGRLRPSEWLGRRLRVVVDRSLGSRHPRHGFRYDLNYGYVPGLISPDGDELDAYIIGLDEPVDEFEGDVVGVVLRADDVEDKLVISSTQGWTAAAISAAVMFQEKFFASRVVTQADLGTSSKPDDAVAAWASLDEVWHAAFEMAWEAVVTGNIGVGAVVSDHQGAILAKERNRVSDTEAPAGKVAGSSVAHAEINALAALPFRSPRNLVLTTTLTPCLQCAAVIRMGPIATVRVAGEDPLWYGCDNFSSLNERLARRVPVEVDGPRHDEVGTFATLLARLGPGLVPHIEAELHDHGETPVIQLAQRIEAERLDDLLALPVEEIFRHLWPELVEATFARRHLAKGLQG